VGTRRREGISRSIAVGLPEPLQRQQHKPERLEFLVQLGVVVR
jgi:hypothetical protein